jgi:hypothetical protein
LYAIFAVYGVLALSFSMKNVKETRGLNDKEQKTLYAPDSKDSST